MLFYSDSLYSVSIVCIVAAVDGASVWLISFWKRFGWFTLLWGNFGSVGPSSKWFWARRCWFKSEFCMNRAPQMPQPYGFSPVCRRMWSVRSLESVNARSQYVHLNGRSPEWTLKFENGNVFFVGSDLIWFRLNLAYRIWRINLFEREKARWHSVHTKGFSPVCVLRWRTLSEFRAKPIQWRAIRFVQGVQIPFTNNIWKYFCRKDRIWMAARRYVVACVPLN